MPKKRILFGATYSVIEPLGLLHLGGLARDLDWERHYHLVKDHDFTEFFERIKDFKPNIVGFNIYTGNHLQLFEAYKRLKKDCPNITTVIGGPHATYFPSEAEKHADYVVMSEGFSSLRKILKGEAEKGIITMKERKQFPHPDRETFYKLYTEHANSHIKSFITMTGCPYKCTYCYNSSEPDDISAPAAIVEQIKLSMLPVINQSNSECSSSKLNKLGYGRLFPFNIRDVNDVIRETREIAENWPTKVLYCQDDIHGFDIKEWFVEFKDRYMDEVGIPYHAQMRWEMAKDKKRLDLLREAGCFGLTLAIEAADRNIREEVLDRAMPEELMFEGMKYLTERGFKVRTEQITGLPYGATVKETKMNLEADLELVELNVKLKRESGGPSMAWGSTLAPYKGTKLGAYCEENGHYNGDNSDVPDSFFERSILRFPKEWVGPRLKELKNNSRVWLKEDDLEEYRNKNAELRRIFNFVTLVPEGHKLAESYLNKNEFSYDRLGKETEEHLRKLSDNNHLESRKILNNLARVRKFISERNFGIQELKNLAPYFAVLPKSELAIERVVRYLYEKGKRTLDSKSLSTATRHHLYDNILYSIDDNSKSRNRTDRIIEKERDPEKI